MIQVYLLKHRYPSKEANGRRKWRWAVRWQVKGKWKYETTGTTDSLSAEGFRKRKFDELNGFVEVPPEPEPEPTKPTWEACREALERALKADNLRSTYVSESLIKFDVLRKMFPAVASPADVTPAIANEYKRLRAESGISPWTVKSDLATLRATFGKWLKKECKLIPSNPFEEVTPPRCDEPDIRIVTAAESAKLFDWFEKRWNNWQLPVTYLNVAMLLGWRATEIASIREEDILADGFVRVVKSKTRKQKTSWLPSEAHADLQACLAGGFAFGRFSSELRARLIAKRHPNQAACVRDFRPQLLVNWMQDELKRFNDAQPKPWATFTLHDFRRTAITGMQMAGVSEKEASIMVGCSPEVMRRHYEKMDAMAVAKRSVQRRLTSDSAAEISASLARRLRAAAS